MTIQEFYAQIGGSYADTVRRLCSESFVLRFVKKYPANPSFDELCEAVDRSDWESAFRAAHTLKGVAQNLGFDRLYAVSVPLTEAMRGAKPLDDFSLLHYQNLVCLSYGRKAVGHNKTGAPLHHPVKGLLDQHFCSGINTGGCLVKDQHRWQIKHNSGNT